VENIMSPVKFVPETMKITVLLKDLQRSKMHMGVVIDEFGGTVGIITLEDIIEELIGEIWDESDDIEHDVTENPDGSYLVLAGAGMNEVMERLGIKIDAEDYEGHTIGGYVLHKFGRIPASNDSIELENVIITVKSVKKRRIREVLITKKEKRPEPEEE
jgi:CBS domain containing-hemolysin-like protein